MPRLHANLFISYSYVIQLLLQACDLCRMTFDLNKIPFLGYIGGLFGTGFGYGIGVVVIVDLGVGCYLEIVAEAPRCLVYELNACEVELLFQLCQERPSLLLEEVVYVFRQGNTSDFTGVTLDCCRTNKNPAERRKSRVASIPLVMNWKACWTSSPQNPLTIKVVAERRLNTFTLHLLWTCAKS